MGQRQQPVGSLWDFVLLPYCICLYPLSQKFQYLIALEGQCGSSAISETYIARILIICSYVWELEDHNLWSTYL